MTIFIDTSAIIALAVGEDTFHSKALQWNESHQRESFTTTNLVFMEVMSWIRYKRGKSVAVELGNNLLSGQGISIERVAMDDERKAWDLFQKADGRGLSMVDCTTAVVMKRLKIGDIFTFDTDFSRLGFTICP
ncbi:MAG TPA: PIN domain-containing protein [Patescibacteria group bacterium]|nr:PIN domain-containing protein [Patescibacteria group bacterium]